MAIRKFWLINSLDKKYEFTNKQLEHFLNSPSGLGFAKSISTLRIGNEEVITSELTNMPTISGDILFYANAEKAYQDYDEFKKFVRYAPLKLFYQPPHLMNAYYVNIVITSVEKSEYTSEGYLNCPISMYATSLWQNANETSYVISNVEEGKGKYYDLVRPYNYAGYSLSNIIINNNGDVNTGFVFEINGEVTNPRLSLVQNNITYGIIKLIGTYDYIKINTNDSEQDIYLEYQGSVIANSTSYQDLSISDGIAILTFPKFKVGESQLAFTCDKMSSFNGNIKFIWKDKRESI